MHEPRLSQEQSNLYSRREFLHKSGAAVALLGLVACGSSGAEHALENVQLPRYIRSGPADRPNVAITIDDIKGVEGARDVEQLLDIARSKDVRFTFFPVGEHLDLHRRAGLSDIWRQAVADGHEIGNHTYSHNSIVGMSPRELRAELTKTQTILNEILGEDYPMRLMRPPGGTGGLVAGGNPNIMAVLAELDYSMLMWTIDSRYTAGHESYLEKIMDDGEGGVPPTVPSSSPTSLLLRSSTSIISSTRCAKTKIYRPPLFRAYLLIRQIR